MARVKRIRRGVVAVVAAAAVGGVVGSLPVVHHAQVQPTVTAIDPASLYNSAQQKFASGDVAGGLESLKQSLIVAPADADSLALQSVWSDQVDDAATGKAALSRLSMINPTLATSVRNITAGVSAAAAIVPSTSPAPASGQPAIVILGYGLGADGTMAPELVKRLTAGKAQADAAPSLPIVVTGGVPKKGITEASAMKKWLVANGVDASRVTTEDKSVSTVSNAQNTAAILGARGIADIVLVTSPNHIRRAAADFAAVGLKVSGSVTTPTDMAKYLKPLTKDQQKGIRLEATRAARIPTTKNSELPIPNIPGLPNDLPDTGPGLIPEIGGKILDQLLQTGSKS